MDDELKKLIYNLTCKNTSPKNKNRSQSCSERENVELAPKLE